MTSLKEYIEIGIVAVGLIAWFARLEMRIKDCKESFDLHQINQVRRDELVREKLDTLIEGVGWIRGRLNGGPPKNDSKRGDDKDVVPKNDG